MLVREALPEDAAHIARIHVDGWRHAYHNLMPPDILDNLSYEQRERCWDQWLRGAVGGPTCVFVVEEQDRVVGFASGGPPLNPEPGFAAELTTHYVRDGYQGRGFGRALVAAVADTLARQGRRSLVVWVLAGSEGNRFYQALSGRVIRTQPLQLGAYTLSETGYGWDDIAVLFARERVHGA